MNIKSFEKLVNERLTNLKEVPTNKSVATTIRRRRKELNYTQGEVSSGICSVSYLSKIENGHLEPENYYVQEIMSRIGIDNDEITNAVYIDHVEELISSLYYNEADKISKLFEEIKAKKPMNVLSAELIYLGKSVYFDELDQSIDLIKSINVVKKDLVDYELKVFMYFIALYESKHLKNKLALDYLNILLMLDDNDVNLITLVKILKGQVLTYLGEYVLATNLICEVERHLVNTMNLSRLIDVKLDYAYLLVLTGQVIEARVVLNKIKRYQHFETKILERYYYVLGWLYKREGDYEKAIKMFLNACSELYYESMSNIIECYFKLKNTKMLNEFLTMINENTAGERYKFHVKLSNYFSVKSNNHLYESKEFISRQLIPLMKTVKFKYYNDIFRYDLIEFHRSNGRYKEIDKIRRKM